MKYTSEQLGNDLKKKLELKIDLEDIGDWAYQIYSKVSEIDDMYTDDILLNLMMMEMGPEFYFSYEALHKLADDLIAGKRVSENLDEYKDL